MDDEANAQVIRQRISEFLDERLETKLNALKEDDPERATKEQAFRQKFERETWIADAARRVSQLQVVTHPSIRPRPNFLTTISWAAMFWATTSRPTSSATPQPSMCSSS